jgi:hypothetical protein
MFPRFFALIIAFSLSSVTFAQVHEVPDSSAVTGVGTYFKINSSAFLNIIVESSENVFGYVQSIPQEITINVAKPDADIQSTVLSIRNLTAQTSYNLIKNGIQEVITSDDRGNYTFEVDLSLPQTIQITPHQ